MELQRADIMIWVRRAVPIILGAIGGYAYWYFIGCASGTCPITGNPWISTIYGGFIGSLFVQWRSRRAAAPADPGRGQ